MRIVPVHEPHILSVHAERDRSADSQLGAEVLRNTLPVHAEADMRDPTAEQLLQSDIWLMKGILAPSETSSVKLASNGEGSLPKRHQSLCHLHTTPPTSSTGGWAGIPSPVRSGLCRLSVVTVKSVCEVDRTRPVSGPLCQFSINHTFLRPVRCCSRASRVHPTQCIPQTHLRTTSSSSSTTTYNISFCARPHSDRRP